MFWTCCWERTHFQQLLKDLRVEVTISGPLCALYVARCRVQWSPHFDGRLSLPEGQPSCILLIMRPCVVEGIFAGLARNLRPQAGDKPRMLSLCFFTLRRSWSRCKSSLTLTVYLGWQVIFTMSNSDWRGPAIKVGRRTCHTRAEGEQRQGRY